MCLPCARTTMHSALSPPYTRSLWAQPLGGVGVWRYWAMEGRASGWCSSRDEASAPVGRVGALFRFRCAILGLSFATYAYPSDGASDQPGSPPK